MMTPFIFLHKHITIPNQTTPYGTVLHGMVILYN